MSTNTSPILSWTGSDASSGLCNTQHTLEDSKAQQTYLPEQRVALLRQSAEVLVLVQGLRRNNGTDPVLLTQTLCSCGCETAPSRSKDSPSGKRSSMMRMLRPCGKARSGRQIYSGSALIDQLLPISRPLHALSGTTP